MDKVNAQRAEQQRAAAQEAMQIEAQQTQEAMDREDQDKALAREHELNQTLIKEGAKNDREEIKSRMKGARF